MCHHGIYDVTLRVQQLGPSDVYMCTPLAPPLKLPVSRAEMVMVPCMCNLIYTLCMTELYERKLNS